MAKAYQVLEMLIPQGGWAINGEEYEGIQFLECEPITKELFESSFDKAEKWLKEKAIKEAARKNDLLNRLGITEDEAKLLLS